MEYSIKSFDELSKSELYSILSIRNKVFVVEQNCSYQDPDGKDFDSFHLMVKPSNSNKIIAYIRIILQDPIYEQSSISRVLVDRKYRGNGIARHMLNKGIKFIRNNSQEDGIKLSAQEYLIPFYKSLGFKAVSDIYLEDGIPHVEMVYLFNL